MIRSAARANRLEVVAYELPLTKDKTLRPRDSERPTGLFVFSFSGSIDRAGLQHGNKFLLVGRVEGGVAGDRADDAVVVGLDQELRARARGGAVHRLPEHDTALERPVVDLDVVVGALWPPAPVSSLRSM